MKTLLLLVTLIFNSYVFSQLKSFSDSTSRQYSNQDSISTMKKIQIISTISTIGIVASIIKIKNTNMKYIAVYGITSNLLGYSVYSNIKLKRKTSVLTLLGSYMGSIVGSYLSYQIINHWDGVRRTARRGGSNALIYPVAILGIAGLPGIGASTGGFLTSKEKEKTISQNNFTMHPYYAFSSKKHTIGLQVYH